MAMSPFASRSPSVTVSSPNSALRLKAAQTSAPGAKPGLSMDRELTEQLNDEVRLKYIKGMSRPEA